MTVEDGQGKPLPADQTPQRRTARGESFNMEFTIAAPDGGRRWFEASGRPIRSDGDEQGGVVVIRDITERSLRRMQDEFLAMASHELRTPLTALRGYLQMLTRILPADPPDARPRAFAERALSQVQQVTNLVNELLDVSRLQTGKLTITPAPLDLAPLVRQTAEIAQVLAQGQTIQAEADARPLMVHGDAGRIEQVLLNLLTNAITYAPDTERIDVRLRRADGWAELEVEDYGPGIPEEQQANRFSRFYQAAGGQQSRHGGLGLGLYIAHEIVEAHGGTIAVRSGEGEGTTFLVRLPVRQALPSLTLRARPALPMLGEGVPNSTAAERGVPRSMRE